MTTATGGTKDDDDTVTMEVVEDEPEPRGGILSQRSARTMFLSLAIVAAVALIAAVLIIAFAPASALTWLIVALVVLVIVIIAEVVLLILARPRTS